MCVACVDYGQIKDVSVWPVFLAIHMSNIVYDLQ